MRLTTANFESVFGHITPYVADRISRYAFEHRTATTEEHDKAVLDMIKAIYHNTLPVSGPTRHPIWENGWAENLAAFDESKAGLELAKPHYHNKYPIVRWQGDLYVPISPSYEYNMLAVIGDWVFDKYVRGMTDVYEFGCGTGHNLFRVRDVCPGAFLTGLDWAESAIEFINLQAKAGAYGIPSMTVGRKFDYFNPDESLVVPDHGAAFVTVASLEQTGGRWEPFVKFVMKKKPSVCIHIEPIEEVLDPEILLDHLSLEYFKKRGYLSGFLRHLSDDYSHHADILEVRRTKIGSKFIEGYTVVVWRPKP
jgi:hypothetical protein